MDYAFHNVVGNLGVLLIVGSYFLVQIAELRPLLAGLVPMVGRVIDAVTDPLMGRISDRTRWRWGRWVATGFPAPTRTRPRPTSSSPSVRTSMCFRRCTSTAYSARTPGSFTTRRRRDKSALCSRLNRA